MDDLIVMLAQMTLDIFSTPSSGSLNLDKVENAFNWLTFNHTASTTSASQGNFVSPPSGEIQQLILLDEKLDSYMKNILILLDNLAHPNPSTQQNICLDLLRKQSNLQATLNKVRGLQDHQLVEIHVLSEAMPERLEHFSTAVDFYIKILCERAPLPSNPRVIPTGTVDHFTYCYLINFSLQMISFPIYKWGTHHR